MADPVIQPVPAPAKPAWQSRTILVSAVVGVLGGVALIWPGASVWLDWLNANGAIVALVWSAVGAALRWATKDAIQLRD